MTSDESHEEGAAMVGFEQPQGWPSNYPEPGIYRERMRAYVNHMAEKLVNEADTMGFVLAITQHPAGPTPAIGRTTTKISVTSKRIQAP